MKLLALLVAVAAGQTGTTGDEAIPEEAIPDEVIPDEAPEEDPPPASPPKVTGKPSAHSTGSGQASKIGRAASGRTLSYQFSQAQRLDVGSGRTRVSVEQGVVAPKAGYIPMQVFIDNSAGPRQVVSLSYRGMGAGGGSTVTRQVEVTEGERRAVTMPVPVEMRSGSLSVRAPGVTSGGSAGLYFGTAYGSTRAILSLSRPESFERFVGVPPTYSGATLQVVTIALTDAPTELAAYVGYEAVVVPDEGAIEKLSEGQRRALEAYAATGGALVLKGPVRSAAAFPLAKELFGQQRYGFGVVDVMASDGVPLLLNMPRSPITSPDSNPPDYERRSNGFSWTALLPQATAPVGSFLLIMTLFTLLIGPGSVWVARSRGPAALLFTIPTTAFVTCVLIVGYSLVADGFTVHTATYGYTLLDSKQHRAITAGLQAYYANLAPRQATFSAMAVPIAGFRENREHPTASVDWKDGARFGGDFVPSRIYREWGSLSVEPTRARVVVKAKGDGWVVQNALGASAKKLVVNLEGVNWHAEDVPDGAERPLSSQGTELLPALGTQVDDRFGAEVRNRVGLAPLKPNQFLARLDGQAFVPTGGIWVKQHDSESLVRGEVEP